MSVKGRKRKQGQRYKSGDLVRTPRNDRGTAEGRLQRARSCGDISGTTVALWAQGRTDEAVELVANDHGEARDAIGRAWLAGLLEVDGKDSQALLLAGRNLALLYWDNYQATDSKTGSIEPRVRSSSEAYSARAEMVDRQLNMRMAALNALGRDVAHAVDSLCLCHNYDTGPAWLDRLIALRAAGSKYVETNDWVMMQLALRGLAVLA
jgi:hypothetical protein